MTASTTKPRKQDRAITFLTQEQLRRLFSAIKNKRDRAILAVAYRHGAKGMVEVRETKIRVAGYIRVSDEYQVEGHSLQAQRLPDGIQFQVRHHPLAHLFH